MEVKYQNLGLKEGYLYEILATTISFKDNDLIPNTSCMGIKIINDTIPIDYGTWKGKLKSSIKYDYISIEKQNISQYLLENSHLSSTCKIASFQWFLPI